MRERRAIGIDIGGTRLRIGLVNERLELAEYIETHEHTFLSPHESVAFIGQTLSPLLARHGRNNILGIGVGYPGPVCGRLGSTFSYCNLRDLRWNRVPLAKMLEENTALPVYLDNDANLAGLAEVHLGAGRSFQHIVYITISTGTGGAIFIDRRLYRGFLGGAGEFGHMVVDLHGSRCKCGNTGCLMSLLSGLGLERLLEEEPAGQRLLSENAPPADCVKKLVELCRLGHPIAREMLRPLVHYVTVAFLNIIHILNPEIIVVGGALGKTLLTLYLDEVREKLRLILPKEMVDETRIQVAELGDHNGVLGGAILVFENV
ncbi:MAG TPA: ROK family protein [Atribacteraceae bacterium]|nr:ROK family protein [Atribacteraceae bacterium]